MDALHCDLWYPNGPMCHNFWRLRYKCRFPGLILDSVKNSRGSPEKSAFFKTKFPRLFWCILIFKMHWTGEIKKKKSWILSRREIILNLKSLNSLFTWSTQDTSSLFSICYTFFLFSLFHIFTPTEVENSWYSVYRTTQASNHQFLIRNIPKEKTQALLWALLCPHLVTTQQGLMLNEF